jgi:hypothetical protein
MELNRVGSSFQTADVTANGVEYEVSDPLWIESTHNGVYILASASHPSISIHGTDRVNPTRVNGKWVGSFNVVAMYNQTIVGTGQCIGNYILTPLPKD